MSIPSLEHIARYERQKNDPDWDPKLLASQDPEILVIECADSRQKRDAIPGKVFLHANIGGVEQPNGIADPSGDALQSYALSNFKHLKTILFLGHTHCGAMHGLVNTILNNVPAEHDDVSKWLLSLAPQNLKEGIIKAHQQGAKPEEIERIVEYLMPVISAQHEIDREITMMDGTKRKLGDVIKEKGIKVMSGVNDLDSGKIQIYEPDMRKSAEDPLYYPLETVIARARLLNPPSEIALPAQTLPATLPNRPDTHIMSAQLAERAALNEISHLAPSAAR